MRVNPTVGEILGRMRRRRGFRSARKSLDPTFKNYPGQWLADEEFPDSVLWDAVRECPELFPYGAEDDVLDAILLDEDGADDNGSDDEPAAPPAPLPLWQRVVQQARDHLSRLARPITKRIQEDPELVETVVGLLVLTTGTVAGLLWCMYRQPLTEAFTWLVGVILWLGSILRQ
jgi:hypothetical protein